MATTQTSALADPPVVSPVTLRLFTDEFRSLPIPGLEGPPKGGTCFVPVADLPPELDEWMAVNPRVPKRDQDKLLTNPVAKRIINTLRDDPQKMAIKNQGIYLLVDEASFEKGKGNRGQLTIKLSHRDRHGIVNGGHTYSAIREVAENPGPTDADISKAYVRLHILQGIDPEYVPDIADGLNRSRQVDDASIDNLRHIFKDLQVAMHGHPGADAISYKDGDDGTVPVTEVIAILELFNCSRFDHRNHPNRFYNAISSGLRAFKADMEKDVDSIALLTKRAPELLRLADRLRQQIPLSAKRLDFDFGQMKIKKRKSENRAGSSANRDTPLPFLDRKDHPDEPVTMDYRVPNGWLFPILAAFRANVLWDASQGKFEWREDLDTLIPAVIDDIVRVCVEAHKEGVRPEQMGKRATIYSACFDKFASYRQYGKQPLL